MPPAYSRGKRHGYDIRRRRLAHRARRLFVGHQKRAGNQHAASALAARVPAAFIDVRTAEEREPLGAPPDAVLWPLAVVQRFRSEAPNPPYGGQCPKCETFSSRDLTPEERFEFMRWLVGHAVKRSELFFFCARGNRSLVAAHILRDTGYLHVYSVPGGLAALEETNLPVEAIALASGDFQARGYFPG